MSWQEFVRANKVPLIFQNPVANSPMIENHAELKRAYRAIKFWLNQGPTKSLILCGIPGRGKTYAMYFIVRWLIHKFGIMSCRFWRSLDLDEALRSQLERFKTTKPFIHSLADDEFLTLDDFGVETNSDFIERKYYDLLDTRIANLKVTIISTNMDPSEFSKKFGDRIASRLQTFTKIEFNGPDLREYV